MSESERASVPLVPDDDWGYWISARIRRRRRDLELTQQELVDRLMEAGVQMSPATWSRIESGKVELAKGAALLLVSSEVLHCSVTYLMGLTQDPSSWEPDRETPWTAEDESPDASPDGHDETPGRSRTY